MKVLIGYDCSPDSDNALKELESSGLPPKVQAIILCVAPHLNPDNFALSAVGLARDAKRFEVEALKQAEVHAANAAARIHKAFPDWKVTPEGITDSPAHGLMTKAEAWKPDLVVLGSHGRTALGNLLMGSVSTKILNYCPVDVRITRIRKKTTTLPRVLISVDGSPGSDNAVRAAASRSWPVGTKIRVISVLGGDGLSKSMEGILGASFAKKGQSIKAKWLKAKAQSATNLLSSMGLNTDSVIRKGDPRIVILNEAKNWDADCIFLGSRGLSRIGRFALGSVSSSVAAHAECTVEIVRKKPRRLR